MTTDVSPNPTTLNDLESSSVSATGTAVVHAAWVKQFGSAPVKRSDPFNEALARPAAAGVRVVTGLTDQNKIFAAFTASVAQFHGHTARQVAGAGTDDFASTVKVSKNNPEMTGLSLYHLSEDVTDTLIADAVRFDSKKTWDETLLPSESGFCVTEDGLFSENYKGNVGTVRVITWHAATHFADDNEVNGSFRQGTMFTFWSERGDPAVEDSAWPVATAQSGPYLLPQFMHFVAHDQKVGANKPKDSVLSDSASLAWEKATGATLTRWTAALLELINTPTSLTMRGTGDGRPLTVIGSNVIVGSLRPGASSNGNGEGVPLLHGHSVRKHYRRTPVGPAYSKSGIKVIEDWNGDRTAVIPIAAHHVGPSAQKVRKAHILAIRAQA